MATAKRLYLYSASAVGLLLLVSGVSYILEMILNKAYLGPEPESVSELFSDSQLDVIALSLALVVAGALLWVSHWILVSRMVAEPKAPAAVLPPPAADEAGVPAPAPVPAPPVVPSFTPFAWLRATPAAERASIVRAVYFAGVLGVSLMIWPALLAARLGDAIADLLGANPGSSISLDSWIVVGVLVAGAVWAYHVFVRTRDLKPGTFIGGAAAWVSRFYLYGAAFYALTQVVGALSSIIGVIGAAWAGQHYYLANSYSSFLNEDPWWLRPIVVSLVTGLVWAALWLGHWFYALRLASGTSEQSVAERASKVRLAFLMGVVAWGVSVVAQGLLTGTYGLCLWAMGLLGETPYWFAIFVPPLTVIPAAIAWFWHRRRGIAEVAFGTGPVGISAVRIASYVTAIWGIYLLAVGLGEVISTLISRAFGPNGNFGMDFGDGWKYSMSMGIAAMVVGLCIWAWPWFWAQRRRRREGMAEVISASRGYYLNAILAVFAITFAVSLAMVIYPYVRLILALPEASLANQVSGPIAGILVATAFFAYHWWIVRHDPFLPPPPMAFVPGMPVPPMPASAPEAPAAPAAPEAPTAPQAKGRKKSTQP